MSEFELSDRLWGLAAPLIPLRKLHKFGGGRPPVSARTCLGAAETSGAAHGGSSDPGSASGGEKVVGAEFEELDGKAA